MHNVTLIALTGYDFVVPVTLIAIAVILIWTAREWRRHEQYCRAQDQATARKADVNLAAQLGPMRPPQAQHVQPPPDGNVIDIGRKRRRVRVHGEVAR
jgi:hypothetical protein